MNNIKINFAKKFPELSELWHQTLNENNKPENFGVGSRYVAWWQCKNNKNHIYKCSIKEKVKHKSLCKYCKLNKKLLQHEIIKEWHPNNIEKPEFCTYNYKAIWICKNDKNHIWETTIASRIFSKTGCPYCKNKIPDKTNSLEILYPDIAKEWHPELNTKKPSEFVYGSAHKAWWICKNNKKHIWETTIRSRTTCNKTNCPYCANRKVCDDNNLLIIFPDIAKEWHPTKNNNLKPENVMAFSHKKVWWQCTKNNEHEWQTTIEKRTLDCSSCPYHGFQISKLETNWLNYIGVNKNFWHKTIYINSKKYNVDAFDDVSNTVYEFYGDYWHGNIKIYDRKKYNKTVSKTFGYLYDKTINRENEIRNNGYNIVSIWELDFKNIGINK